jgi:adenosylmethionine-8-amino-7-oxononanoate aminotransferase
MSAVLTTDDVYGAFYDEYTRLNAFLHSHSYCGNPLACTAALASLDIFRDENILGQVQQISRALANGVARFADHPNVTDIRQCGSIVAIEYARDRSTREPFPWRERRHLRIYRHALERGVLLRPLGNVIYFMPPYIVTPEEIELMVDVAASGLALAVVRDAA